MSLLEGHVCERSGMDTDEFSDKNVEAMERFHVDGAFHNAQGIPLLLTAIFTSRMFFGI